jgi:6-phosphogluconolactonase (cycloisomerase 2 family)
MRLFVASYVGTITTLDFALDVSRGYSLDVVASTTACSPNPSWISLDPDRNVLYCTEPGVAGPNGTLVSLSIQPDGGLSFLDSVQTPIGAAYSGLYDDNQALGVAY